MNLKEAPSATEELRFKAKLEIIGINPFVDVPARILAKIFLQAGKDKGPIPIRGTVNGEAYTQTLVKYQGSWRLYVNARMLSNSPQRIGETLTVTVVFDQADRTIEPHPKLLHALKHNKKAKAIFDGLRPSLQKEIVRYIASLKTEKSIEENVTKAIAFLLGKGRFVGRDNPN